MKDLKGLTLSLKERLEIMGKVQDYIATASARALEAKTSGNGRED